MAREAYSGHLDLLLLSALSTQARHGWGVIQHVRQMSGGRFDYPEGTIYPALHRLEEEGLLRSKWSNVEGRRRRVYELTRSGHRALHGRKQEWQEFARGIAAVIERA